MVIVNPGVTDKIVSEMVSVVFDDAESGQQFLESFYKKVSIIKTQLV